MTASISDLRWRVHVFRCARAWACVRVRECTAPGAAADDFHLVRLLRVGRPRNGAAGQPLGLRVGLPQVQVCTVAARKGRHHHVGELGGVRGDAPLVRLRKRDPRVSPARTTCAGDSSRGDHGMRSGKACILFHSHRRDVWPAHEVRDNAELTAMRPLHH